MKKIVALWLICVIFLSSVYAENDESTKYYVNGSLLTEMSVEEIYDLEDAVVSMLMDLFGSDTEGRTFDKLEGMYVINTKTKKYHYPWCYSALQIDPNKRDFLKRTCLELPNLKDAYVAEYKACGNCSITDKKQNAKDTEIREYIVNGHTLSEMTIPELYDFEDVLVSALTVIFNKDMEGTSTGELIGWYVINEKTQKFHYPWCYSALEIEASQRSFIRCSPSDLANPSNPNTKNYSPCGSCRPHVNG